MLICPFLVKKRPFFLHCNLPVTFRPLWLNSFLKNKKAPFGVVVEANTTPLASPSSNNPRTISSSPTTDRSSVMQHHSMDNLSCHFDLKPEAEPTTPRTLIINSSSPPSEEEAVHPVNINMVCCEGDLLPSLVDCQVSIADPPVSSRSNHFIGRFFQRGVVKMLP